MAHEEESDGTDGEEPDHADRCADRYGCFVF